MFNIGTLLAKILLITFMFFPYLINSETCKKFQWSDNYKTHKSYEEFFDTKYPLRDELFNPLLKRGTFSNYKEIPAMSPVGFKKIKIPPLIWAQINNMYKTLLSKGSKEEFFEGKDDIIPGDGNTSDILNLEQIDYEEREDLHYDMLPIFEKFSGQKLVKTYMYGIRSYLKGSKLTVHVDRVETHHISAIIIVDKDLNGQDDWPLDIQAHDGSWHKVYAEKGEMILYESAICHHARFEKFKGTFFRNMFIHYRFRSFLYQGRE